MASGIRSTVGGGSENSAEGIHATVAGGGYNSAEGDYATVSGGEHHLASGRGGTIPGGWFNEASGDQSFAAGYRAHANGDGSFVWADFTEADFDWGVKNSFSARASGGVNFFTNSALTTGVYVSPGDGTWHSVSDRNVKENFRKVDVDEVLRKVVDLPITTWNYKTQSKPERHMGPVAQDLYAAFGLGDGDKSISTIDADGIALAAIQGLNQRVQDQQFEIRQLRKELAEMRALLARSAKQ